MQTDTHGIPRATSSCLHAAALLFVCLFAGCHHQQPPSYAPPPPEIQQELPTPPSVAPQQQTFPEQQQPSPPHKGKALYSEVGVASWYGEPYRHSHAANGQIYHQDAMTAANKMLPMGSVVCVTNLETHQSVVVTITDRGPFVPGRMIDLSRGAAQKAGIRQMGVARVRMDVLRAPKPIFTGGRWIVQIGALRSRGRAVALRNHLLRQYPDARVIEFAGNTGYWVRIRTAAEDRRTAEHIARNIHTQEAFPYLVRVD